MTLTPGTRLGPYQIGEPIGAGGMGEVYRARDTRLDRSVAIKVLPAHLASLPDLRERFEREARAVSSLNHPNICTLHDIGSQDGIDFLVMEYLEGETLADRLSGGRTLKLADALEIAMQIADALDKAHRQGVVHRDLKPGNVMLTKAGASRNDAPQAKLLDFGLAKQAKPAATVSGAGQSIMPTEGQPLTAHGAIIGTFQYMAPEQLEGQEADARTDIFAFGVMLYEMVTGRRAFEGKSHVSLIAAIVDHDPPPMSSLTSVSPPLLDHLVKTCLAKNPDRRWQTMADVLIHFRLIADSGGELASSAATQIPRRLRLAWSAAAVLGVLLVVSLVVSAVKVFSGGPSDQPRISFDVPTPASTRNNQIAISASGSHLVVPVLDGGTLWVRALEHLNGQTLPGTEGAAWPFWSPDGRFIAFFADGKLKKVDMLGGPPATLADAAAGPGGSWNRDDTIVFSKGPLFQVSSVGGIPKPLTELDTSREEFAHAHPYFLPDGRHFLYLAVSRKAENTGIVVASLDSKDTTFLVNTEVRAAFVPPNQLLFMRENTLMAQRFHSSRLELDGDPFPIAEDVGANPANGTAGFSVSDTGILAYRGSAALDRHVVWFDRSGKATDAVEETGRFGTAALAPSLHRIAVSKQAGAAMDIWILDLARDGASTRLTTDPGVDSGPIWSPDGSRLVFSSDRGKGVLDLYEKDAGGVVPEVLLWKSNRPKIAEDWSADGRFLLYRQSDADGTGSKLWALPMSGERRPTQVVGSRFRERDGRFSPNGRWIAYASNESGRDEVYVQGFPSAASRIPISTMGGMNPAWRGDGKEVFFTTRDGNMMAVDIGVSTDGSLKAGFPHKLFSIVGLVSRPEATADGQRFLMLVNRVQASANVLVPITVVVNWDRAKPAVAP